MINKQGYGLDRKGTWKRGIGSTFSLIGHVVASLDKALFDDYLCLVASNKQQIKW